MALTTQNPDTDALSYDRLEQPWRDWARIARNFSLQIDDARDKEDLVQDIILELAKVAAKYKEQGRPLTRWGCIKVAQYRRSRFYHDKHRWKRVFSIDLNSTIQDEDGNETELVETIPDREGIDLDTWLDFKSHFEDSPARTKEAIRKLLYEHWRQLSGHDYKLIRQFRAEYKAKNKP